MSKLAQNQMASVVASTGLHLDKEKQQLKSTSLINPYSFKQANM